MAKLSCPVCGSGNLVESVGFRAPVFCNVLYKTREEAEQARQADFQGVYCEDCGHFFNAIFDEALLEYSEDYDTSLHFSASFQDYATSLADRLVSTYDLRGKSVIELGCGRGDFLRMVCEGHDNQGHGFDTSYDDRQSESADFLSFYKNYYSAEYAEIPADFVVCRHVLEHVPEPLTFLTELRTISSWTPDTVVYFEVPNGMYSFAQLGIWDFIYEHFSYFNATSLRHVFERAGFEVLAVEEGFGGQYLCIEARPSAVATAPVLETPSTVLEHLAVMDARYREKLETWRGLINDAGGAQLGVWGAGSKGVSFVNLLTDVPPARVLIDVNPGKQGRYVPGTGQQVVGPEALAETGVDLVVIMNPNYRSEIETTLRNQSVAAQVLEA